MDHAPAAGRVVRLQGSANSGDPGILLEMSTCEFGTRQHALCSKSEPRKPEDLQRKIVARPLIIEGPHMNIVGQCWGPLVEKGESQTSPAPWLTRSRSCHSRCPACFSLGEVPESIPSRPSQLKDTKSRRKGEKMAAHVSWPCT